MTYCNTKSLYDLIDNQVIVWFSELYFCYWCDGSISSINMDIVTDHGLKYTLSVMDNNDLIRFVG